MANKTPSTSSSNILHSDLAEDLSAFSYQEKQRFLLFLKSPYFIGRKDVAIEIALVHFLFQILSEPESVPEEALQREQVHQLLFPGEAFNSRNIIRVFSSTLELARAFVEVEMLQRGTTAVGKNARLADFFTEKRAVTVATRYVKRLERGRAENNSASILDFWEDWQAESAKSRFETMHNDLRGDMNIQKAVQTLETYYWIQRLDFLIALLNLKNFNTVLGQEDVDSLVQEIEQAASKPWGGTLLGRLYLSAARTLYCSEEEKDAVFDTFFELFSNKKELVSQYHSMRFETILYNFCVQRLHDHKYSTCFLRIYENRWRPTIEGDGSSVLALEFLNIVKIGLLQEDIRFVQQFVEMARHKIAGIQPSEMYYSFAKASCLFAEGKFRDAYDLVCHLDFQDNLYRFFSKILEIKILYEGGPEDARHLDRHLKAFRMLVKRETNASKGKTLGYETFHQYVSRLHRYRNNPRKFEWRLKNMQKSLEIEPGIYDRRWLRQKTQDVLDALSHSKAITGG